jgi:thiopeptide-type bacteriocin biosynthesis protein
LTFLRKIIISIQLNAKILEGVKKMKKKNDELFIPLDFFMFRIPILPIEFFKAICFVKENKDNLSEDFYNMITTLSQNPSIRETIAIASKSLFNSVEKIKKIKNSKKRETTIINFLKYLIRMSTRPTPFGLFAGITTGNFVNTETNITILTVDNFEKKVKPDMEWILNIIKEIEEQKNIVEKLHLTTNSMSDCSGERAFLPYNTNNIKEDSNDNLETVSIRYTEAVEYAFECAKEPITYKDLLNKLHSKYHEEKKEVIDDFLWKLFESEFFISELKPPLLVNSPFDYFKNRISNIKELKDLVEETDTISRLLKMYEESKVGGGLYIYLELTKRMEQIKKSKNYLSIDLIAKKDKCFLNEKISKEIAKVAKCLWRLSPEYTSNPVFISYRNEFIEKYGIYREVPVLELLDPDRGLGAPAGYEFPMSNKTIERNVPLSVSNMERFIQSEMVKHKFDNQIYDIELTDKIIEDIEPIEPDYSKAPISIELYFSIFSKSQSQIEKENYQLIIAPNPGSFGAGKTFGRFMNNLDEDSKNKLRNINTIEKSFYEDVIFAEIVFIPISNRAANICILENYRDYEIVLSTNSSKSPKNTLDLNDIYIGTTYNQFYIKSKSLGKRIIITTSHMLNLNNAPNIYRFLREISTDGTRMWSPLSKGTINDLPFVPEIKYSKTILSPATWNFSWDSINEKNDSIKNNPKKFIEKIKEWRKKWYVPRYVYLTEMDNRILLDLESNLHLKLLLSETNKLKNYSALSLVEAKISNWIEAKSGSYFAEFVVPLVKNKNFKNINTQNITNEEYNIKNRLTLNKTSSFSNEIRIKYPGSDWLFLKFYGNSNRENEFIAFRLREICKQAVDEKLAERYFFMRYDDPEPHIRLRFNGEPTTLTTNLLPQLYEHSVTLKKEGLLSRLVLDTYEREVERYGGPESINFAEDVFYKDSEIVQEFIYLIRNDELNFDLENLVIVSIIDYLNSFELEIDEQIEFLNSVVDYKLYLNDFRDKRKLLMKITDTDNDWIGLKEYEDGALINEILSKRHLVVKRFTNKFELLALQKRLYNSKNDIIASVIHLHCNRILGIDRVYENKLMTLARHSLYNLKMFKEKQKKNKDNNKTKNKKNKKK